MASEKISNYSQRGFGREAKRITGLEPVTAAWKAEMLPLHHIRILGRETWLLSSRVSTANYVTLKPLYHMSVILYRAFCSRYSGHNPL